MKCDPVPVLFVLMLWQQRNRKTFNGVEPNDLRLNTLMRSLMNWSGILLERDFASLLVFTDDLNCGY